MNPLPPVVLRLMRGALLVFPVLSVLFWLTTPLGLWGALCLAFFLELLPALALAQLPLVTDDGPLSREPVYLSSAVAILGIGGIGALVGWMEFGVGAMGLTFMAWPRLLLWTGGLSLAALALLGGFHVFRKMADIRETPILKQLLPVTRRERAMFVFLSMAAGIGEEIAYRGFLIPALTVVTGSTPGALLLSSAVFGLLHAYQGWLGIARTAALGLVLAVSLLVSGSLWPAVFAHAIVDVLAGLVFGKILIKE